MPKQILSQKLKFVLSCPKLVKRFCSCEAMWQHFGASSDMFKFGENFTSMQKMFAKRFF